MDSAAVSVSVGALPLGGVGRYEKLIARIGHHPRDAASKHIGQRGEVGHRGRLATVQRVLNGGPPATGFEINEVWHVARSNVQAERVAL